MLCLLVRTRSSQLICFATSRWSSSICRSVFSIERCESYVITSSRRLFSPNLNLGDAVFGGVESNFEWMITWIPSIGWSVLRAISWELCPTRAWSAFKCWGISCHPLKCHAFCIIWIRIHLKHWPSIIARLCVLCEEVLICRDCSS